MRLRSMDGWRGFGAVLVAIGHLELGGYANLGGVIEQGYLLVDFFFVFSGFVIAYAYGEAVRDGASAARFLIKRLGRIWPLHLTVLMLFVGVELAKLAAVGLLDFAPRQAPFTGSRAADLILPNVLLLNAFGFGDDLSWNFPSWTVAAEFWTYGIFALLALATVAPGRRGLRLWLAGLLAAVCGLGVWALSPRGMDATFDFGLLRCAYGFGIGMLTYAVTKSGRLAFMKGTGWEAAIGALALLYAFTAGETPLQYLAPFVFAPLTLVFAQDAGRVSALLSVAPLQALGRWSYSIYLVHAFVVTCVMPRLIEAMAPVFGLGGPAQAVSTTAVYLAIVVALSAFTYRFVELPGQAWFGALADRMTGKAPRREAQAGAVPRARAGEAPAGAGAGQGSRAVA